MFAAAPRLQWEDSCAEACSRRTLLCVESVAATAANNLFLGIDGRRQVACEY